MEGPFHLIRNEWQRTPLQRIEDTLNELTNHLDKIKKETNTSAAEIHELEVTKSTLQEERYKRIKKEKRLNKIRNKLIENLVFLRQNSNQNTKQVKKLLKKIKKIDNDLGPYRHNEFYLD